MRSALLPAAAAFLAAIFAATTARADPLPVESEEPSILDAPISLDRYRTVRELRALRPASAAAPLEPPTLVPDPDPPREELALRPEPPPLADLVRLEMPPAPPSGDAFPRAILFRAGKRWYAMERTRAQWERWRRKAEAWRSRRLVREAYGGDSEEYFGELKGRGIASLADALISGIQNRRPNRVTRSLVRWMRLYDRIEREMPITLRDEARDYFERRVLAGDPSGEELAEAAGLDEEEGRELEPVIPLEAPDPFYAALWEALRPSLGLRVHPRAKPGEPSARLGARLRMRYGDRVRIRIRGDFDTRDREASAIWAVVFDW